jgi:hypothetical protein
MGPKILPQVVRKLKRHIFTIELCMCASRLFLLSALSSDSLRRFSADNKLQTDPNKKVSRDDMMNFYVLNLQVVRIIELYASHVVAVQAQVSAIKAYQRTCLSSHSNDQIDHDSFRALVAMEKNQIYPLVMAAYAEERDGWWHEMLYQLEHGMPSNAGTFNKSELYEEWRAKFEVPSLSGEANRVVPSSRFEAF